METYKHGELFYLTELGQYLKNVLEFLFLKKGVDDFEEIKWNVLYFDWDIITGKVDFQREFFLEIVIVLKSILLDKEMKDRIKSVITEYFLTLDESVSVREIEGKSVTLTRIGDFQKDVFYLKKDSIGIPNRFNRFEICISIESFLRDKSPSPKLILSNKDIAGYEKKVIDGLMKDRNKILDQLNEHEKPVIICEGKTDKTIIEIAWNKLYLNTKMPFQVIPSGVYLEIKESEGSAEQIRRTLELIANKVEKTCIGLFDNDKEGNEQFKGLNKNVFEGYELNKFTRKHKKYNIYGMLLPVPDIRKGYVGQKMDHRFFVIEHYFSDDILKQNEMIGDNITPDSKLFRIKGNKIKFAENVSHLEKDYFDHFKVLFDKILEIINQ
jgi:5S rRNA maturation endonuclease (ribonuclease M5)